MAEWQFMQYFEYLPCKEGVEFYVVRVENMVEWQVMQYVKYLPCKEGVVFYVVRVREYGNMVGRVPTL